MSNIPVENIYATCVQLKNVGILLLGKSGSGKSDLALRLIEQKHAVLVADDRVDVRAYQGCLYASPPPILTGKLEVRGVGIIDTPYAADVPIALAVRLMADKTQIDRMPTEETISILNIKVEQLKLFPFEISAVDKVVIKLKAVLDKFEKNHKINDTTSRKTIC